METQYTRLSMTPSGVPPVIYMSQNDIGRPIGFICDADLSDYSVVLDGTRTDGTPITVAVTVDGNICAFETTATMTNKADVYIAQIVVTNASGKHISSIPIKCVVVLAAMDENSEGIEEDAPLYQQYTGTVQSLIADIRTQLNAETAARQAAVSAEASARQAADNQLQSNINTEASTRATQDASLQSQINQLVAPSGSAPSAAEITNARVGADGTVYPTLGDAIRTQVTDVKNHLSTITGNVPIAFTPGYYINTGGSTVDVSSPVSSSSGYGYAVINVSEGDEFTVTSSGGSNARAWCFIDSNGAVLDRAASGASANNLLLVTPIGADKLIINAKSTDDASYYGQLIRDAVANLRTITSDEVKQFFEVGGLSTSGASQGKETNNSARARTDYLDVVPGGTAFFDWSTVTGFVLAYVFQYHDGVYVSKTISATINAGVISFNVSVNANQCRFVIKKSDESDFVDSDLVGVYIPTTETIDVIFRNKINGIEDEIESVARDAGRTSPNDEQYVFSRNVVPYAELTNLFNGLATGLKFVDFYNKFHELYTTYGATNPGMEEINVGSQIVETAPAYFSSIPGAGMYMWHIPPLPDNGYQPANTYKRLKVFLTSGIHGSERNAIVTIYAFMRMLLQGYGDIPQMFRNLDIYIMPLCSPYGIENNSSYNGNDININRDFPVRNWQADTGDHSYTEPDSQYETKCIMYTVNQVEPDVLIDHHCFSGNIVGATKRLYWGTSAYGISVSKLYEVFAQLNFQVRENFTDLFEAYNFIYAYTRYVSDSSGTLCRWSCEQGINGATVECPNTLKWDDDQGYIWATGDDDQRDLVSVSEMYFTNALTVMCDTAEFYKNRGIAFGV